MMQQLLPLLAMWLTVVNAANYLYPVPSLKLQSPVIKVKASTQSEPSQVQQYFSQDSLGQYSYGYSEPLSTKQEVRTSDGITRGSYSYIDANGLLQTVDYTADADGFHVAATNLPIDRQILPQAVTDTPEVAAAREQHLAVHRAILQGDTASSSSILPQSVKDTPEVMAAKKEFFARYAAEEEKHKALHNAALLQTQGLGTTSFGTSSPLSHTLLRPAPLSASTNQLETGKFPFVNYGIHYAIPSNLARFYLPVA